jgi:hypothetical protein
MSPGFIERPDGRFSAEPRDRRRRAEHRGPARHVELHVAHLVAGLDRDPAGVERHGLADEAEHGTLRVRSVVSERDQLRLLVGPPGDAGEGAHPGRLDLRAAHDLQRDRVVAVRDLARALGQRGRREVVGGPVLEVAREVHRLADDAAPLDGRGHVVVGGDDQLAELGAVVLVVAALEHREVVGAHHAALDEGRGVRVGDMVRELPAQRARTELTRARDDAAGDDPGAFRVELVALAEAGDEPAPALGVGERELAKGGLGLARVGERAEHAARRVVRDPLLLEQADRDRVRPRPWRRLGGGADVHAKPRILVPL